MSLRETKAQMIQLLAEPDTRVIALSGRWGTGKSHLLEEIRKESASPQIRDALYVSLFGLSDLTQVKLTLMHQALPQPEHDTLVKKILGTWNSVRAFISSFRSGAAALSELSQLIAPLTLKNKIVIFDDVERKHESLGIDEVLGFINEFTEQHECRFVLVLNTD